MRRNPCCSAEGLKKGSWTEEEDRKLLAFVQLHGERGWKNLPKKAGIMRCGKSCRLRWANYLRPGIKRGNFSPEEEEIIIRLHAALGNRWATIARHLYRRTDNEVKNYWNTRLKKRVAEKNPDQIAECNDNNKKTPQILSQSPSQASTITITTTTSSSNTNASEQDQPCSGSSTSTTSTAAARLLNLIASNTHLVNLEQVLINDIGVESPSNASEVRELTCIEGTEFQSLIEEFLTESKDFDDDADFDQTSVNGFEDNYLG